MSLYSRVGSDLPVYPAFRGLLREGGHAILLWDFPTNFKYLLDVRWQSLERLNPAWGKKATRASWFPLPHRGREGLQPGDAVMGDPSRFPIPQGVGDIGGAATPVCSGSLRSLPVPRARRGEVLPAVSPQGEAFVF